LKFSLLSSPFCAYFEGAINVDGVESRQESL
jgi:hypothetical protein